MECLFLNREDFIFIDEYFYNLVNQDRYSFINSDCIYNSLKGYLFGERRLALGERTGLLGSDRKNALEKYGFSPKNFSHLLRLCFCGITFFTKEVFPTNIMKEDERVGELLKSIKLTPDSFTKDQLITLSDEWETKLDKAFDQRSNSYVPDLNKIV